jgi:hypothetical protein
MRKRIGPKMTEVAQLVAAEPGCTKMSVAHALRFRGHKSNRHGYAVVDRAIGAGLVMAVERQDKRGAFRLYPKGFRPEPGTLAFLGW